MEELSVFIGGFVIMAALGLGCVWLESAGCASRWEKSGLQSSWGPLKGCQVKSWKGNWIPEDSIRDVETMKGTV